jgi:O-antigen/teichoic acid export membrane protein
MAASVASRVASLGALTAAGQLVIIGSLPLYSRVFEPDAYGAYLIFVGAFTVVSVLAGLRYDSAIVLPRSAALVTALFALVMLIALSVSALIAATTLGVALLGLAPRKWDSSANIFGYGLAAATLIGALQRCLTSYCIRAGRFVRMGGAQFLFCVATVVAQLSFAAVARPLSALIWGHVCALGVQSACLAGPGLGTRRGAQAPARLLHAMRLAARKYRRFPAYMVGYALASSARDRLIQMVLGFGAGPAAVGRFGLAYRVAYAPNSLLYSAVSPVFYGIASRGDRLSVGRFAAGLVEATFVMFVVPYVAFALEAPLLTDAVLSDKWHGTGPYLQALAAPALLLTATCWLDRAFDSFRRQKAAFSLEASFTILAVALVAALSRLINPVAVAWAYGVLACAYYWVYFLVVFVACGFELAALRRACMSGLIALLLALTLGAAVHRAGGVAWRLGAYALLTILVVALWTTVRGGKGIVLMLAQTRTTTSGRPP